MFQVPQTFAAQPFPDIGNLLTGFVQGRQMNQQLDLDAIAHHVFKGGLTKNADPNATPTADTSGTASMPGDTASGFLSGAPGFPTSGIGMKMPQPQGQSPLTPPSGIGLRLHDPNQPGDTTGDPMHPFVGSQSIAAGMGAMNAISANAASNRAITGGQNLPTPTGTAGTNTPTPSATATGGDPSLGMQAPPPQAMSNGAAQAVAQMAQGGQQGAGQGQGAPQQQTSATGQPGMAGDMSQLGQAVRSYTAPTYTLNGGAWKGSTFAPNIGIEGEIYPKIIQGMIQSGLLNARLAGRDEQIDRSGAQYGPNGVRTQGGVAKNVESAYGEVAPHVDQTVGEAQGTAPTKVKTAVQIANQTVPAKQAVKATPEGINAVQAQGAAQKFISRGDVAPLISGANAYSKFTDVASLVKQGDTESMKAFLADAIPLLDPKSQMGARILGYMRPEDQSIEGKTARLLSLYQSGEIPENQFQDVLHAGVTAAKGQAQRYSSIWQAEIDANQGNPTIVKQLQAVSPEIEFGSLAGGGSNGTLAPITTYKKTNPFSKK